MPDVPSHSELQLDSLKEVANIGAGRMVACLSNLINRACLMSPLEVAHREASAIKGLFAVKDPFVISLHAKILGERPTVMFIVTPRAQAHLLVRYMTKTVLKKGEEDLNSNAQFILKQMGQLMGKAFSESLNRFLQIKAVYFMPEIIFNNWSLALDNLIDMIPNPRRMPLVIHSTFY